MVVVRWIGRADGVGLAGLAVQGVVRIGRDAAQGVDGLDHVVDRVVDGRRHPLHGCADGVGLAGLAGQGIVRIGRDAAQGVDGLDHVVDRVVDRRRGACTGVPTASVSPVRRFKAS